MVTIRVENLLKWIELGLITRLDQTVWAVYSAIAGFGRYSYTRQEQFKILLVLGQVGYFCISTDLLGEIITG